MSEVQNIGLTAEGTDCKSAPEWNKMELTLDYMKNLSDSINLFIQKDDWNQAEELLLKNIGLFPEEYWLYTTLSEVYLVKKEYEKSFIYSKKAIEMNPRDVLVIYNYAESLLKTCKIQ